MFKKVLPVVGLLLSYVAVKCQLPTQKTLLWKVSGKGITQPSYLFGTIHIMCEGDLKIPTVVKEKFNSTQELFLEIDMDDPGMMMQMMQGMQMNDTSTLKGLMGTKYDSASTLFQKTTGMPLTMLNKAKPALLMSMLYPSLLGCTPVSWESVFQTMAHENKMLIQGLENIKDQMDVFDKIPYSVQSDMFTKMLFNIDSSKRDLDEMLAVYKSKDINKLTEITADDADFGKYEGVLLTDRNHNWIPIIGEQAKKSPTFFAFGAGHLGGANGVIYLLRKAGFTVTPVMYN